MRGIEFPEATTKLLPAEGTEDTVYPLHVWSDGRMVISKWKMTWRERIKVLFTGVIWFDCWHQTHPPINMRVDFPFERNPTWPKKKAVGWGILFSMPIWLILIVAIIWWAVTR